MKKIKLIFAFFVICSLSVLLICCSENKASGDLQKKDKSTEPVESGMAETGTDLTMEFSMNPKELQVNEAAALSVKVTSKGKAVTDAEVVFEIWKEGLNEPLFMNTKSDSKGTYTLKGQFSEAGTYSLIAHVSTLYSHQMQTFQFTIQ
ncbi:FixH family protein [Aeribacillus pallidus]|jgi:YtkA-like|uniref:FixH family protein n=1 Tax=Aeribacillus composti TaxID=1868734 RepID=UPI0028710A27|nr:FixH family protein [Aeribacillus pallidus]